MSMLWIAGVYLVWWEVEEQLSDLVVVVVLPDVARPRHAILKRLGSVVHQCTFHRLQRLNLQRKHAWLYHIIFSDFKSIVNTYGNIDIMVF